MGRLDKRDIIYPLFFYETNQSPSEVSDVLRELRAVDEVLQVIFQSEIRQNNEYKVTQTNMR
jgi:hypothetical protein